MIDLKQELEQVLNVEFTADYNTHDMYIGTFNTADMYEIFIVSFDTNHINWEEEVYYYKPSFTDIMDMIGYLDEGAIIYCDDFYEYFEDYEIIDYLSEHLEEDKFEEISNEYNK